MYETNLYLGKDVIDHLSKVQSQESSPLGKSIIQDLLKNAEIAKKEQIPICQDTGMAVVFVDIGQEVQLIGGNITEAIQEGVRQGYRDGYLRRSVVRDPLNRQNTQDNTPAVIYYDIIPGDQIQIKFAPKGFGSENMSQIKMLKPSDGRKELEDFVVQAWRKRGKSSACCRKVGSGGTMDKAAVLAKKALLRPIGTHHAQEHLKDLEQTLLEKINQLGIGPQGLGGNITALAVHVEVFATHIAGLPVAVNINCHAARHGEIII